MDDAILDGYTPPGLARPRYLSEWSVLSAPTEKEAAALLLLADDDEAISYSRCAPRRYVSGACCDPAPQAHTVCTEHAWRGVRSRTGLLQGCPHSGGFLGIRSHQDDTFPRQTLPNIDKVHRIPGERQIMPFT